MIYKTVLVSARGEKMAALHGSLFDACREAMSQNPSLRSSVCVVEGPNGRRYTIREQREILEAGE